MKTVINFMKKATKWYIDNVCANQIYLPTGIIPYYPNK